MGEDRGVLYIVRGSAAKGPLERSLDSLKSHHPELPVHVARLPDGASLLDKARMGKLSPIVLPLNSNLRPRWHKSWLGPIKVWHDYQDVPATLVEQYAKQAQVDAPGTLSVLTS